MMSLMSCTCTCSAPRTNEAWLMGKFGGWKDKSGVDARAFTCDWWRGIVWADELLLRECLPGSASPPFFLCFFTACVPSLCPPEREDERGSSEVSVRPEEVSSRKLRRWPEGLQGPEGLAVPESVPLSQKNQRKTVLRLLIPLFASLFLICNCLKGFCWFAFNHTTFIKQWIYIEHNCKTSWSVYVHQRLVSIQMVNGSSWGGQLQSGDTGLISHKCPCAKKKRSHGSCTWRSFLSLKLCQAVVFIFKYSQKDGYLG